MNLPKLEPYLSMEEEEEEGQGFLTPSPSPSPPAGSISRSQRMFSPITESGLETPLSVREDGSMIMDHSNSCSPRNPSTSSSSCGGVGRKISSASIKSAPTTPVIVVDRLGEEPLPGKYISTQYASCC